MQYHSSSANATYYACTADSPFPEPIVLIGGWGMSSQVWHEFIPLLVRKFNTIVVDLPGYDGSVELGFPYTEFNDLAPLAQHILSALPERFIVVGWSMGGMLANYMASRYPQRLLGVVTIASNPCYVQRDDWPCAMAADNVKGLQHLLLDNPEQALKQFVGMQCMGGSNTRQQLKDLRRYTASSASLQVLSNGLKLLAQCDVRECCRYTGELPVLHILGDSDQLVPCSVADDLRALNGHHQVAVIPQASHALFLTHGQLVAEYIAELSQKAIANDKALADKRDIALSFSQAAKSYDGSAAFQHRVAKALLSHLPRLDTAEVVIDLGCGTGQMATQLVERFPQAQVYGVDLAMGMLDYGRQHQRLVSGWFGGDAEQLPVADHCVDLVYSSLALQWCASADRYLQEAKRVLKAGGLFVFTTLGPKTFAELRQAWQGIDNYVHVNRFTQFADLEHSIAASGFSTVTMEHSVEVLEYQHLHQFMRELKQIGANNVNRGRTRGLMGKSKYRQFVNNYEAMRLANGMLPVSYEVYWICLRA